MEPSPSSVRTKGYVVPWALSFMDKRKVSLTPFLDSMRKTELGLGVNEPDPLNRDPLNRGNRYLAWAWIEAANFAIRFSPPVKTWYQRNAARKPRVVALKAVAHKLARAGFHLMRDGGRFDVHRAFA